MQQAEISKSFSKKPFFRLNLIEVKNFKQKEKCESKQINESSNSHLLKVH
jgi:hypothetical protein